MPRIVCTKCGTFFHPKKNGVTVEEGMPTNREGEWTHYKLWMADLLECRSCGTEIVAGFAAQPVAEHYQADYQTILRQRPVYIFVKDCL